MADQFIFGVAPIDYSPVLLLMPFGFHLAMDTLPSGNCGAAAPGPPWSVSSFRLRARLGFSIPSSRFGQRGITPAFGYGAPHSSAGGTSTLLTNALLSAHYAAVRLLTPSATASSPRLPVVAHIRQSGKGEIRSPRFRRVPSVRNGVSDHGRAVATSVTVRNIWTSTCSTAQAAAT